jgi:asparagine synthase (glutamine-hydrolysing)
MSRDHTRLPGHDDLRGADAATVRAAMRARDPLPGTGGFAGSLRVDASAVPGDRSTRAGPDREADRTSVLVRDVLGRQPLFVEATAPDPTAPDAWGFDPGSLATPEPVPAGAVVAADGVVECWSLPEPPAAEPAQAQGAVESALTAALATLDEDDAAGGADAAGDTDAAEDDADAAGDADATEDDAQGGRSGQGSTGRLAVAFSGGVDSALVASGVPDAPCYVAGFDGCHDVAAAREAARAMDRTLRVVTITHDALRRAVVDVALATGRRNPMDLAIAVPLYLTAEAAAADGVDRLAVGQGADELFGGYSKVVDPADDHRVDADTVRGARTETVRTLPAQLERDVLALRAAGVEPVTPLLDDRLVAAALRLPASLLATPTRRKIALRRAASGLVPESVRTADKKAVQYGTYVSRELDRLARQRGFKRRLDDHVGQYVEALLAEATETGERSDSRGA